MKAKKLIALTIAAAMTLGLLAGCGNKTPGGSQSASRSQPESASRSEPQVPSGSASEPRAMRWNAS